MKKEELFSQKNANLMAAISRQEGEYVPTGLFGTSATVAWAGKRTVDVLHDPELFVRSLTAICDDMWVDSVVTIGATFTPRITETFDPVQYKYGPDGTTLVHLQMSPMLDTEYDQLIADPNKYVSEVLLPRKYPRLYSDPEWAKNALKVYAEDRAYSFGTLFTGSLSYLQENYGITPLLGMTEMVLNPIDILFDSFRGFRGTLTDLRRRPKEVKAAIDKLWEVRVAPKMAMPLQSTFPYAGQVPHIAPYLSPKQFEELYWPYEKLQIERIANAGGKVLIFLEGRWEKVWHHFLELPKDCCILVCDDDDIIKLHKELGHHQLIAGGLKLASLRKPKEEVLDEVKHVIDECAPGGGFLFCTDKSLLSPSDVNQNLVDAYNFAHEYSKK